MRQLNYQTAPSLSQKATLGLIVLSEDETIELEMRQFIPEPDVALHVSRVRSGEELTPDTIMAMKSELTAAAAMFPRTTRFECVGYACTSGASLIGAEMVAKLITKGCHTRSVTDPLTALTAYCQTNGFSNLAFLSPYRADVSTTLRERLSKAGIETPNFGYFGEQKEAQVVRISQSSIAAAARELAKNNDIDALFLSCTNLRTQALLSPLADELKVPILSSNSVLAWHMRALTKLSNDISE